MPESYIFLSDTGRQRSECPSETAVTLEMTPVGFLKSWLPFLWMYSHSPLFHSCLLSTKIQSKDGPCLEEHITYQKSVKGISENTKYWQPKRRNRQEQKIFTLLWLEVYLSGDQGPQNNIHLTWMLIKGFPWRPIRLWRFHRRDMATAWQTGSERPRQNTETWGWNGVKEIYLVCQGWGLNRARKKRNPTWQSQGCNQVISHVGNNAVKLRSQGKSWEDKSAGEARKEKNSCDLDPCKSRGKDWVKEQKNICYRSINI